MKLKNDNIKFEIIHFHKKRIYFLCGFVCVVVLLVVFIIGRSYARYHVTEFIPLLNGTINYDLADLNAIAVYIEEGDDYSKSDTIPSNGYIFNQEASYYTVNGEEDASIIVSYDVNTQSLSVSPLTTQGTKCYLYFDEHILAKDTILANKTISDARSGAITGTLSTDTTGTIYRVADDDGDSYVFAGAPTDNWVSFAGYYWRIIRINGDGSIRLIYNGISTATTGSGTMISSSQAFNSLYDDNAYVGYMYGSTGASSYASTHTNTNNSSIKTVVDKWYRDNLLQYAQYISTEAGFCGDREMVSGYSGYGTLGYGSNNTVYAPTSRFLNTSWINLGTQNPTLKCSQSNDLYMVSGSSKGNHVLTYPIGLITADEVVLVGGFGGTSNNSYYLYNNANYWTMSPLSYNAVNGSAIVFLVWSSGSLSSGGSVNWTGSGVRPVINLSVDVTISSGDGISSNPYVIS